MQYVHNWHILKSTNVLIVTAVIVSYSYKIKLIKSAIFNWNFVEYFIVIKNKMN